MTQRIDSKSSGELRDGLADVISRAQLGMPTEITNRGKRVAVVVPPDVWDKYLSYATAELKELVSDRADEEPGPLKDVLTEVVSDATGS